MNDERDDEATRAAIRELFAEANRPERPPPFEAMWPGARASRPIHLPRRRPLPRFAAVVLAGALALVLAVIVLQPRAGRDAAPALAALDVSASWQGPLDFLLRTPGYEFLATVPEPSVAAAGPLVDFQEILEESPL